MTTAFINGTFDILHPGHIKLLSLAKELAKLVIVAIDSDARCGQLKRIPVNNQNTRLLMLEAIKYVDRVFIFSKDEHLIWLCNLYKPDFMIKGSDYRDKPIIGSDLCKELIFVERTDDSTTKIIERISNRGDL
jgi:D-beta-D-heptose 7-phosphate kinase / D-beta-D-heptose 1-phosphate adenosyltransferase